LSQAMDPRSSASGIAIVALGVVLAACGSSAAPTSPNGQGVDARPPPGDGPTCAAIVQSHPIEGNLHEPVCSPLSYGTNPPSSGNHYAIWASYRTYTQPFLPGFWVHCLEHGAVVIVYNCPDGCADDVARAQALIDALPADCGTPPRRVVMLPNPDLDVRFAASTWGFTLRADCFDSAVFASFVADHYGHGPEAVCADGIDPLTAGTGGTPLCP
jgi:uncharacterized protein DUF3105